METKKQSNDVIKAPDSGKHPLISPLVDPDELIVPEEDPDMILDEDPFESPPPYEEPEPGEGP